MSELELPNLLVSEVKAGNVVLVLGAGASVPAMLASGVNPPITGARLAKLIAEKFLGDKYTKFSLTQVAELAISEAGLFPVQDFVASLLEPVRPTPVHTTLASFRWKGLATTNYDRLLEHAYAAASASPQSLVPFIDNTDRVEERTRAPNSLLFLKLHGCISRTHNTDCPLLLSTDQFLEFKRGRSRLFGILKEWASECPLLFVGYGLQDSNIRLIIDELTQELPARPRYYLVLPDIEDIEKRYWENRKITAIKGNIESLVEQLDSSIGRTFRSLAPVHVDQPHPVVHSLLRPRVALSTNAVLFLDRDADCVNAITATEHMAPRLFYRGFSNSWSPIEQALDVPRQLTDTLTLDYVLEDTAAQGSASVQFVVIKAHAGAGKTVLMRRLAWNAAKEFKRLVLYIRADGVLDTGAIAEIVEKCDSPVLIFVDQALERRRELERLFSAANMPKGRMIVFCAVRTNEWNQAPDSLTSLATDEFELGYLSSKEIRGLLQLLKQHSALGNLTALNEEQRMERLVERAGRQLLVALHEATLGEQFERIVRDEYYGITPHAAQSIYLSVCLLNQFGVSVRAGVISRLFGVPFESFKEQFLGPLEEIIIVEHDSTTGDYRYAARHPHIAEMVVRSVLSRHELLFNEVVRCVRVLNPSYSSDRTALQRLLQGRAVLDSFPDPQMAQQLYQAAEQSSGKDPFLLQQQCIYEMKRPNGDLQRAGKLLDQAMSLAKHSTTILHTLSELKIRQAELSALPLERRKLVREALEICNTLRRREPSAYVYYT
ncbi:MAG: SIR2 family protein, partial [Planctomycetota bacterium]